MTTAAPPANTIASYPPIAHALDGSEAMPIWQDGGQKRVTPAQIGAFAGAFGSQQISDALAAAQASIDAQIAEAEGYAGQAQGFDTAAGLQADRATQQAALAALSAASLAPIIASLWSFINTQSIQIEALNASAGFLASKQPAPVAGDLIDAEIMGDTGLSFSNAAAVPYVGGSGVPSSGKMLRLRFKGIGPSATFDATKASLATSQPGFGKDKIWRASNFTNLLSITGLYRQANLNSAVKLVNQVGADLDVYCAISDYVFYLDHVYSLTVQAGFYGACTSSTIAVVKNNSTRPYEMPVVDLIGSGPFLRMPSTGLYSEWAVWHHAARNGQTVAAVDIYVTDNPAGGGNISTVSTNSMIDATKVTGPYHVPVFAGTVPIGPLVNGDGGLSIKVYPWVTDSLTPWDLGTNGDSTVASVNLPAFTPVKIDTDNSWQTVRGYVSDTGAQVGSPTVTTGALPAYVSGTTPAFASIAAVAAAVRAFNNSNANRVRVHDDIDAGEAVIPSGFAAFGLGANMGITATYPVSNGPMFRVTSAAGANVATTGLGPDTANTGNKTFRHLEIENITLFPGAAGTAAHAVLDGGSAGVMNTAPPSVASVAMFRAKGCFGVGNSDNVNTVIYRGGYRWYANCGFTNIGLAAWTANYTFYQGVVIHGGTHDYRGSAAPQGIWSGRIAAAQLYQLVPNPEDEQRTFQFMVGQSYWCSRYDFGGTGAGTIPGLGTQRPAGIGPRGMACIGNIMRQTATGGPGAEKPSLALHADYFTNAAGNHADYGPLRNVSVVSCTINGGRYNRGYLEINDTFYSKEIYERDNAGDFLNTKSDLAAVAGPASSFRTGNWPIRFATGVAGWRVAAFASNDTTGTPSPSAWAADVMPPRSAFNIGHGNMYVSNTGTYGSNNAADLGDYRPKAALLNVIAAGRAAYPKDLNGTPIPNDGTGAAGAVQNY